MSRRPARKARVSVTYERPWENGLSELFDLVGDDWRPPATVKVRRTLRGLTITALFHSPEGTRFTAHVRARLQRDGEWAQTERSLGVTFSIQGTIP